MAGDGGPGGPPSNERYELLRLLPPRPAELERLRVDDFAPVRLLVERRSADRVSLATPRSLARPLSLLIVDCR